MNYLLSVLVFVLVFIPASSFFELKIAIIFFSLFFLVFKVLKSKVIYLSTVKLGATIFFIFFMFVLSLFYSVIIHGEMTPSHFRAFFSYAGFFLVIAIFLISFDLKYISVSFFYKSLIMSSFFYGVAKLMLVLLPLFGVLSVRELKDILFTYVGSVTYEFWTENAPIARISFGNDIIIPFVVALIPFFSGINLFPRYFIIAFSILSYIGGVFSFTRYIWLIYVFIFFYDFFIIKKRYLLGGGVATFIAVMIFILFQFDWFGDIVSIRSGDTTSLDTKSLQSDLLLNEWLQYPFFGKGIGSYIPMFLRSDYQPYIYEVQWSALLMQFGAIGLALLLGAFLILFRNVFFLKHNRIYIYTLILLWFGAAFTNPYLFIMSSSVVYLLFINLNCLIKDNHE